MADPNKTEIERQADSKREAKEGSKMERVGRRATYQHEQGMPMPEEEMRPMNPEGAEPMKPSPGHPVSAIGPGAGNAEKMGMLGNRTTHGSGNVRVPTPLNPGDPYGSPQGFNTDWGAMHQPGSDAKMMKDEKKKEDKK